MTRRSMLSPRDRIRSALCDLGTVASAGLILWIVLAVRAEAHDAASGWSYPFACCSGHDCREVSKGFVGEKPEGFVIGSTGEVVGYQDERLRNSPDGEFHWCSVAGKDDGKTICLFVPPKSF